MKPRLFASSFAVLASFALTAGAQCPPLGPPTPEKLIATGFSPTFGDQFGRSVAIDGNVAVVGAWLEKVDSPDSLGAVYVFEFEQGCWVLKQRLVNVVGLEFGRAVAVSGDRILVGNWKEGVSGTGAAYIYKKDGSGCWVPDTKLQPDPGQGQNYDLFGASVAIEGDRALVGAREDDDAGGDAGAVYVFERVNEVWSQTQKILPPAIASTLPAWFGNSVSISGDRALIGAWVTTCEPPPATCQTCFNFNCADTCDCDTGAALVYDRMPGGQWALSATLTANDAAPGDGFGAVALSGDVAVVGAYEDDAGCVGSPPGCNSGSAYVFERDMSGNWSQTAHLVPSDSESLDNAGISVAVAGTTIVVGARYWDGANTDVGAAYVFAKQGTAWNQIHTLTAPGAAAGARLGIATALSKDGERALAGAIRDDGEVAVSGAAYVLGTSLTADRGTASILGGESVNFSLWAGQEPGRENLYYILLGSLSGSCPGTPLDAEHLPLNFDGYTNYTLTKANKKPLSNSLGTLDAQAAATASFDASPLDPGFAGLSIRHAFVVFNPLSPPTAQAPFVRHASNAVEFQLVP